MNSGQETRQTEMVRARQQLVSSTEELKKVLDVIFNRLNCVRQPKPKSDLLILQKKSPEGVCPQVSTPELITFIDDHRKEIDEITSNTRNVVDELEI